jgi:hypothetical protein
MNSNKVEIRCLTYNKSKTISKGENDFKKLKILFRKIEDKNMEHMKVRKLRNKTLEKKRVRNMNIF